MAEFPTITHVALTVSDPAGPVPVDFFPAHPANSR